MFHLAILQQSVIKPASNNLYNQDGLEDIKRMKMGPWQIKIKLKRKNKIQALREFIIATYVLHHTDLEVIAMIVLFLEFCHLR